MVSCDHSDMGCQGGMLPNAWNYIKNTGLLTDSCFPYGAGELFTFQRLGQIQHQSVQNGPR